MAGEGAGREADASVHPCDKGQGYYVTVAVARVFNADGDVVHRGTRTSRPRFLANCVG
ncbi:MAG: hypothetical protein M3N53_07460 [Actinomycetota bacterium]|nr:hypothetical protein [Actinomycetota bacterium]